MSLEITSYDYGSPRITAELTDCSMPMTFDSYSNCAFGCLYCFSTFQRELAGAGHKTVDYFKRENIKAVNLDGIKKLFTPGNKSNFEKYIMNKMVMQWGGLSDPFCPIEKKNNHGLKLLRFFREIDYPICFSTKGTWWLDDTRYTELFKDNPKWNVKVSIITLDEKKARIIEKGVPSPQERIEALRKITELNAGGATLRLRPFMIGISSPTHLDLIRKSREAGATAISTEFFCLDLRSRALKERLKVISYVAGFDYTKEYKKYSDRAGYLRLNRNYKRKYINEMYDLCKEIGMRFYVSDPDFKERCNNGSCCGLDTTWNYSRGQFTEALIICKEKGVVTWDDMEKSMDHLVGIKAEMRHLTGNERFDFRYFDLRDLMRYFWNNTKHAHNPYRLFKGVMKPSRLDNNQNVIYVYDKTRE